MGSGFVETETGRESDEPMHIAITYARPLPPPVAESCARGPDDAMIMRGKELAEDLMEVVRMEWNKTKQMNDGYMQQQGYGGDMGYQVRATA
jgi:hypothetical protein